MGFKATFNYLCDNFKNANESKADFMVMMFSALVAGEERGCDFFDHTGKYYNNIVSSDGKNFKKDDLRYFIRKQSKNSLHQFFKERISTSDDSQEELAKHLGFNTEETLPDENEIIDATVEFFISSVKGLLPSEVSSTTPSAPGPTEAVKELDKQLAALPRPRQIPVPEKIDEERERTYIDALYDAYSDDAGYQINETNCTGIYADDLGDRRIDFFSAESIRCGIDELHSTQLEGQFDVLKTETWNGVKNTYRRVSRNRGMNGYDRMLEVMDKAAEIPVDAYILSRSKYWISNRIKQGVCHFLVNDKVMVWKQ